MSRIIRSWEEWKKMSLTLQVLLEMKKRHLYLMIWKNTAAISQETLRYTPGSMRRSSDGKA